MYIETKHYKLCKEKWERGRGVVGFLMAKNLLMKNIIKALIDSSAKGVWMGYPTLIRINIKVSLSNEA